MLECFWITCRGAKIPLTVFFKTIDKVPVVEQLNNYYFSITTILTHGLGTIIIALVIKEKYSLKEGKILGSVLSQLFFYIYLIVSISATIWVYFDTRKRDRPLSESIAWALFMTPPLFPLAIVTYFYFRRKNFFD